MEFAAVYGISMNSGAPRNVNILNDAKRMETFWVIQNAEFTHT